MRRGLEWGGRGGTWVGRSPLAAGLWGGPAPLSGVGPGGRARTCPVPRPCSRATSSPEDSKGRGGFPGRVGEPCPRVGAASVSEVPPPPAGAPQRRTWSRQSQIMLYIIWVTQKQCRKLWKGLFL